MEVIDKQVDLFFKSCGNGGAGLGTVPFAGLARALQVGLSPLMPNIARYSMDSCLPSPKFFRDLITAFSRRQQVNNLLPLFLCELFSHIRFAPLKNRLLSGFVFCDIVSAHYLGGVMSEDKKDNVEYFPGKSGFYKKGPGEFKLDLGNLDDLIEEAEEDSDESA